MLLPDLMVIKSSSFSIAICSLNLTPHPPGSPSNPSQAGLAPLHCIFITKWDPVESF